MNEFQNRVDTQRKVLKIINSHEFKEVLLSLSEKSIQRWVVNNQIDKESRLVILITNISEKLFFLANKSQEQITEDYKNLSIEVSELISNLKQYINSPLQ